jgi:hypothetical protein
VVQTNPDKPWNYRWLSGNPSITWDVVQANPNKPWDYGWLSENPSITWEVVQANPNKPWNYGILFNKYRENFYQQKYREYFQSEVLHEFNCVFYHPDRIQMLVDNCLFEGFYSEQYD